MSAWGDSGVNAMLSDMTSVSDMSARVADNADAWEFSTSPYSLLSNGPLIEPI